MKVLSGGVVKTFLDVSAITSTGHSEQGLLSVAFPPDYAASGLSYVFLTGAGGALEVYEYRRSADPDVADPATRRLVISIPHTEAANHNGGQLQFGPDGLLYIGTGDGGQANDTPNSDAEVTTSLLGKILRIDPRGRDAGRPHRARGQSVRQRGLVLRPAQPVAVLVRPLDRRSCDRRRWSGAPGGDQLRGRRVRPRARRRLWLALLGGHDPDHPELLCTGGFDPALLGRRAAGEPDVPRHRLQPRRRRLLLDHRRLRRPRPRAALARRPLPLCRLLRRTAAVARALERRRRTRADDCSAGRQPDFVRRGRVRAAIYASPRRRGAAVYVSVDGVPPHRCCPQRGQHASRRRGSGARRPPPIPARRRSACGSPGGGRSCSGGGCGSR